MCEERSLYELYELYRNYQTYRNKSIKQKKVSTESLYADDSRVVGQRVIRSDVCPRTRGLERCIENVRSFTCKPIST